MSVGVPRFGVIPKIEPPHEAARSSISKNDLHLRKGVLWISLSPLAVVPREGAFNHQICSQFQFVALATTATRGI